MKTTANGNLFPTNSRSRLMIRPFSRSRLVRIGLAAVALCSTTAGLAATYTYTPTNPTGDLWSAGTDWTAIPLSAATTELAFVDASGSTTLANSLSNINTDDNAGLFQLNILDLGGSGPASGAATININSSSTSNKLD